MTVERAGDVTMLRSKRTPEEQSAVVGGLLEFQRRFEAEAPARVAGLEALFAKFDTFDLLGPLMLELFHDPETYEEEHHTDEDAMVEYAALLCLKGPYTSGTGASVAEAYPEIRRRLSSLITQMMIFNGTKGIENPDPVRDPLSDLQRKSYINELFVRNPGYPQHGAEVLKALFGHFDTWFTDNLGFTANDLIKIDFAVMKVVSRQFHEGRNAAKADCAKAWEQYQSFRNAVRTKEEVASPLFERLHSLPSKEAKNALNSIYAAGFCSHLGPVFSFTADDLAGESGIPIERVKKALAFFSLEFGSNEPDFVLPRPVHALKQFPFIGHGERYMCPNRKLFLWAIQPRLEGALKAASGSTKLFNRYSDRRADYLEKEALRLLAQALGGVKTYQSLKYKWVEDGYQREGELDGLVIYDDVAFLVEAKAGAFPLKARRGYDRAIIENLKALVTEAHGQGLNAQKYLEENPTARFRLPDETELTVDRQSLRKIILVAVTLESLDVFCTNLHRLSELKLFESAANLPWAVPLLDLRIIAETVEFPSQLIHYLGRRLLINQNEQMEAHDEVDWWGHYLAEGLLFDKANNRQVTRIQVMSFTGDFDKYYLHQLGERKTPSPKPRQQMPQFFRQMVLSIENSDRKGRVAVICDLLDMDGKTRQKFASTMEQCHERCETQGRIRDFTMVFNDGGFGVTCFVARPNEASRASSALYEYCQIKKYQAQLPRWVCLLSLTGQPEMIQSWYVLDFPWQEDAELKRRASLLEKKSSDDNASAS
ncbi:MAG: hypothetical protein ACLQU3_15100 [Limisphaerales bacterium]